MRPVKLLALSLLLLTAACHDPGDREHSDYDCEPRSAAAASTHPRSADFAAALAEAAHGLPGATWHIHDAEGTWTGAVGLADIEVAAPMRICTPHRIASATKSVVATTVLSLAEEGALDLDDPIGRWLDGQVASWYEATDGVTVRNLLNHTSGYKRFFDVNWGIGYFNNPEQRWTTDEMLEITGRKGRSDVPIGEVHAYSNANYLLLAEIIEQVTSAPHEDVIAETIFEPLDLAETSYQPNVFEFPRSMARAYMELHGDQTVMDVTETYAANAVGADGGIISTSYELGTFLRAVLAEKTVLSQSSLDALTTWVPDDSEDFPGYGLGFGQWRTDYGDAIGHIGQEFGYLTVAYYFPDHDTVFVFTTNTSSLGEPVDGNLTHLTFEHVLVRLLAEAFD